MPFPVVKTFGSEEDEVDTLIVKQRCLVVVTWNLRLEVVKEGVNRECLGRVTFEEGVKK